MAENGIMDWNDVLENDGSEFVLLPEGDYRFKVASFERGRFVGSTKIPACNKAILMLDVTGEQGTVHIKTDLILHKSLEWKLAQFFRSIGLKEKGKAVAMDWQAVPGAQGRCHVIQRTWTGNDGKERVSNDVDRFLDWEPEAMKGGVQLSSAAVYEDIPF